MINYKTKKVLSGTAHYAVCILMSFIVLFPFLLVILTSLKTVEESAVVTFSLPKVFMWENFAYVMEKGQLMRAFKNSMIITGFTVLFTVLLSSVTAFVITRRSDKLSKALGSYFLIGMIAPLSLIPEVIIVKTLGLSGTYAAIILIHLALRLPLSIYSFVGYMTYKWNYVCAFIVLSILPILLVYCLAQKYIVDGMIAGAVKN